MNGEQHRVTLIHEDGRAGGVLVQHGFVTVHFGPGLVGHNQLPQTEHLLSSTHTTSFVVCREAD